MRKFAQECPVLLIVQQPAAQLPWFHIVKLLSITDLDCFATLAMTKIMPTGRIERPAY